MINQQQMLEKWTVKYSNLLTELESSQKYLFHISKNCLAGSKAFYKNNLVKQLLEPKKELQLLKKQSSTLAN